MKETISTTNRGNSKYYINYDKKERECGNCHKILKFSHFSIATKHYLQTYCKPCRSKIKVRRDLESRANSYPNLFYNCSNENCDHIWMKKRGEKCLKCNQQGEQYV